MSNEFGLATKAVTEALTGAVVRGHSLTQRSGVSFAYSRFEQAEESQGFDPRLEYDRGHFIPDFFVTGAYTFKKLKNSTRAQRNLERSAACFAVAHAHHSAIDQLRGADILASAVPGGYRVTNTENTVTVHAKMRVARGDSAAVHTPRRSFLDVAQEALQLSVEQDGLSVGYAKLEHDVDSTGAGIMTLRLRKTRPCATDSFLVGWATGFSELFLSVFDESAVHGGFTFCGYVEHKTAGLHDAIITIPFAVKG